MTASSFSRCSRSVPAAALLALCLLAATFGVTASAIADPAASDISLHASEPGAPSVGDTFGYTFEVVNEGPADADGIVLDHYVPYDLEFVGVSTSRQSDACAPIDYGYSDGGQTYPDGGSDQHDYECTFAPLTAGDSASVTFSVTRTSAWPSWASAWAYSSAEEANWENNYAEVVIEADPSSTTDLAIERNGPTAPLSGQTFEYALVVTNNGPSAADGVVVNDYFGDGLEYVSSSSGDPSDSCSTESYAPPYAEPAKEPASDSAGPATGGSSPPVSGAPGDASSPYRGYSGLTCDLGSLASGDAATVTVTVTRTSAREIWTGPSVWSSMYDPNYENNWVSVFLEADTSNPADLSVSQVASSESPAVDENFDYLTSVTNLGPSVASDVVVSLYVPYEVDYVSSSTSDPNASCTYEEGDSGPPPLGADAPAYFALREVTCEIGALDADATLTLTTTVTRRSGWPIWSSAWASTSSYDGNWDNDYAWFELAADPSNTADLSVTKTAPDAPVAGEEFDYTLGVTNAGPAPARDVTLSDPLPPEVELVSWTASDPGVVCSDGGDPGPEPEPKPYEEAPSGEAYPYYYSFDCALGDLASGDDVMVTLTVTRAAPQAIWNSAWVSSSSSYDPSWENNYAWVCTEGNGDETVESGGGEVDTGDKPDDVHVNACGDADEVDVDSGGGADEVALEIGPAATELRQIHVAGGPGADHLSVTFQPGAAPATVTISGGGGNDAIEILGPVPSGTTMTLRGKRGADVIRGSDYSDTIFGGRGHDVVIGGAGQDVLDGGSGHDSCLAGPGADSRVNCE